MSKKNYPQKFRVDHSPTICTFEAPIRYSLIRSGAFEPERKNPADAGIDFFVPLHTWETKTIRLEPGARILIPTGIRMEVPAGWALIFLEKSGVATKFGIIVGARVVDHNYRGEIHIHVINTNNDNPVYIDEGDKLVQGIFIPVGCHPLTKVDNDSLFGSSFEEQAIRSDRGEGGFGSTGTKRAEVVVGAIEDPEVGNRIDEAWKNEEPENETKH